MAIGTGSRYDPSTGERQDYQFEYTPASQMAQGGGGMQFDMQKAMQQVGVQQAEQAMIAATRFQGQRGYQQDIQNGVKPDQALAKWGPLMFFSKSTTGAGGIINALKPQTISPYQQEMINLARQREQRYAGPQPMTPYQQQSLELRKQAEARLSNPQKNPLQEKEMELRRIREMNQAGALASNSSETSPAYNAATNNLATLKAMARPPSVPATNAPAQPTGKKVRVRNPKGQWGLIPEEQLDAALAQGYKQ